MQVIGIVGRSGSGKTTLIGKLIQILRRRGLTVSTIKYAHADFDIDQAGKDSWLHRQAGATEVLVSSARRFALMHELRGRPELPLQCLLERLAAVDIVLVEGSRDGGHLKIQVHRPEFDEPISLDAGSAIAAIASPDPVEISEVAWLPLGDPEAICDFICSAAGTKTR